MQSDKKLTEEYVREELARIRTPEQLEYFYSWNAKDLFELYEYFFGYRSLCDCSMELQCAVFDANPNLYSNYADAYFINKVMGLRWDKNLDWLPDEVKMAFFGGYNVAG